jgi:hypothetical protein
MAEIEAVMQKYSVKLVALEVFLDGNSIMKQIRVIDNRPIRGVQLGLVQDAPAANETRPKLNG